jgi:hypothetical protein
MNFGILRVRSFYRCTFFCHREWRQCARVGTRHQIPRARGYLTHLTHLTYLTLGLLTPLVSRADDDEFRFHSVGASVGLPANSTSNDFLQSEAFLNYNLWRWNLNTNWHLQSRIGISAGWLGKDNDDAFIGTLGPALELTRGTFPLSLDCSFSPTYISRYHFGLINLGENVQFTTLFGLNWDVVSHWRVGYHFQHMSNAGIKEPNPGFNLHVFSIAYLF